MATRGGPNKLGVCALCGHRRQVTREHVPPKNLFLPPRPKNTITVPVCEPCNHGYHLDDEYFRVYIACVAEPGTTLRRLWTEKVVGSSFVRGAGLRGRLNDDHAKLVKQHKIQPIRFDNCLIVPDNMLPQAQPFSAERISGVVEKIVRCLHFRDFGSPITPLATFEVDVSRLNETDACKLYEAPTGCVGNHEEFFYRRENAGDGMRWLLGFYRMQSFVVRVNASQQHAAAAQVLR